MKFDAEQYWNNRYFAGGNSGKGSRGEELEEKTSIIIDLIKESGAKSVLDAGAGDGFFARKILDACKGIKYHAVDFSENIMEKLVLEFGDKIDVYEIADITNKLFIPSDVVICSDVLFHIQEHDDFIDAIYNLWNSAKMLTIFTAWNDNLTEQFPKLAAHVFYHKFPVDGYLAKCVEYKRIIELKSNPVKNIYVLNGGAK